MVSAPQKRLFLILSVSVTPAGDGGPAVPLGSPICISVLPPGKPQTPRDRTRPAPPTCPSFRRRNPPGDPRSEGHLAATPPRSEPAQEKARPSPGAIPVPQTGEDPATSSRPPATRTHRAALPVWPGSAPVRLRLAAGGGSGLALWPRGPARAQSAAPCLLPPVPRGPPPPRLAGCPAPAGPPQRLPGQRRASVT